MKAWALAGAVGTIVAVCGCGNPDAVVAAAAAQADTDAAPQPDVGTAVDAAPGADVGIAPDEVAADLAVGRGTDVGSPDRTAPDGASAPDAPPGDRATCDPCSASAQCQDAAAACVAVGTPAGSAGFFCMGACGPDGSCPAGSACETRTTAEGANANVCIPTADACGCGALAKAAGWTTPCFQPAIDAAGLVVGNCAGTWSCAGGGCDAPKPAPESCNGKDDDCDGQTDEGDPAGLCDEGNPCTQGAACVAGTCKAGPDLCACHADAECGLANLCQGKAICDKSTLPWACKVVPGSAVSCDLTKATACASPACEPTSGQCKAKPQADGTPCDADASACTAGDSCQEGKCKPGAAVSCDDGNPCSHDACGATGCSHLPQVGPCDDGNACTGADACKQGVCQAGPVKPCSDGLPCTVDGCDAKTGGCTAKPGIDGAVCDDGNACTVAETCQAGACQGGAAKACSDSNPCTADGCAAQSGCTHEFTTQACEDGSPCTIGDTCAAGQCKAGTNNCTCATVADCLATQNKNPCAGAFQCDTKASPPKCVVVPGSAPVCPAGGPCTVGVCNPVSGACAKQTLAVGAGCDDGDACTATEKCDAGAKCVGTAAACSDGLPCTVDACDKLKGCAHTPMTGPCNDGNACTAGDTCAGAACVPGPAQVCADNSACTLDGCAPATGCTHDAKPFEGKVCGSGAGACGPAACAAGVCVGIGANPCNDGNPCTDDSCISGQGCSHAANAAACSDGNPCTTGDGCAIGACKPGGPTPCGDGNSCTDDNCTKATGCTHAQNVATCDDDDACSVTDTCAAGACKGSPKVCDDGVACTLDACIPGGMCSVSAAAMEGKACPPPGACNANGTCGAGKCTTPASHCPVKKGREIWPPIFPKTLGPAQTMYDPVGVHTAYVTVAPDDWTKYLELVASKKQTNTFFPADVTIDGVAYGQVGIRTFGYGSLFYNPNKPNIRVKFDAFVAGKQGPDGLHSVRFKSSGQDRTYLKQPLSQMLVQLNGGYAPRFSWVRVWVNGQPKGLYQLFEHVDKKFYHANFDNDDGNEYQRKTTCMGLNCPPAGCDALAGYYLGDPGDAKDVVALAKVGKLSPDASWAQEADGLVNFESLLAEYAWEAVSSDIDSLAAAGQNFTIYHNLDTNKLEFIPTGQDLVMGTSGAWYDVWKPWGPPNSWCNGRVDQFFTRIVATPGLQAKLLEKLKFLRCGPFATATFNAVIDNYRALLKPDVYGDPAGKATAAELDAAYASLKKYVVDRNKYLDGVVGACP
ncbi:MAG: hypothetical protein EXR79_09060 [Myxococcales bacterium]|nr:hypothetical protein [Myxococcales bacterium]